MRKLLLFTLKLALLIALAVWFADRSGTAHFTWDGYEVETSTAFLGFCGLVLGFGFYLVLRFWNLLRHGPAHLRMRRKLTKFQQGHDHLTQGLIAVAGGDASEAGRRAVQARRLLGHTVSSRLLQAQAAQLAGDSRAANEIFRNLASDPDSAILGYRGLIMEARRERNWTEVDRLVNKLHRLRPETPWLNLMRFENLARRQAWDDAHDALAVAGASRHLDATRVKHNRAALHAAMAQDRMKRGDPHKALGSAEQAMKLAPDWLPAILTLSQAQGQAGHRRAMQRTIEKNWARHPHPQLASLLRDAEPDAVEACRQVERLCASTEDQPVSRLVMAEAALEADIWGAARRHLTNLIGRGAVTQSVYRLMAKLERREHGDEQAALQWMTKAVEAPADPVWLCTACGGSQKEWHAVCDHCGSFNTLDWHSPGVSRGASKHHALSNSDRDILADLLTLQDHSKP